MCEHGFHQECLFTWDDKSMINILLPGPREGARGGAMPINDWNGIFETRLKPEKCLCLHCTLSQAPQAAKRTWKNAKKPLGWVCSNMLWLYLSDCQTADVWNGFWIPQRKGTFREESAIMSSWFTLLKCLIAAINGQILTLIIGWEVTDKLSYFVHHLKR